MFIARTKTLPRSWKYVFGLVRNFMAKLSGYALSHSALKAPGERSKVINIDDGD
jgi:hypothetical protein